MWKLKFGMVNWGLWSWQLVRWQSQNWNAGLDYREVLWKPVALRAMMIISTSPLNSRPYSLQLQWLTQWGYSTPRQAKPLPSGVFPLAVSKLECTLIFVIIFSSLTPNTGLELMTPRSRVTCSINWASQVPLEMQLYIFWVYLRERAHTHAHELGRGREGEIKSQTGFSSVEPDSGLELRNHEIMTWAKIKS